MSRAASSSVAAWASWNWTPWNSDTGLPNCLRSFTYLRAAARAPRATPIICAPMIGVARGARAAALKYVKERKQFGKPVSEFQGVQFQLAQAATELEAARLMVYNAARLEDAGEPYTTQAAMAKLFAAQVAERVTSLAVELFGGYGYTKEYPVEKFYRDAKIGAIYEGTSNMQLNTIAKQLLK